MVTENRVVKTAEKMKSIKNQNLIHLDFKKKEVSQEKGIFKKILVEEVIIPLNIARSTWKKTVLL